MALAFVQKNSSANDNSATSLAVTLNNVGAGNLIVIWAKFEGAATTISVSDGTTAFQNGTMANHANADLHASFAYLLIGNSGNKTFTCTFGAARPYVRLHVWEFSYSGTASLDVQNTGTGTSANPLSGNVTTTGTDEVAVGGYGEYGGNPVSAPEINAVAANGSTINEPAGSFAASWYRLLTATFTTGHANVTMSNFDWICNIISFKVAALAGLFPPWPLRQEPRPVLPGRVSVPIIQYT